MGNEFDAAFEAATAELGGDTSVVAGTPEPSGVADAGSDPGAAAPPAPELPELKPDDNWSKEAKEAFAQLASLPEHGRKLAEAWHKEHGTFDARYRETQSRYDRLNHEYGQTRGFVEQLNAVISPYTSEYHRAGMTPIQGIQRALAWEAHIRENPQQAILQLAQQAGVNIEQLAAGQPYIPPEIQAYQQQVDSRLNQVMGYVQQEQQRQQYYVQQQQAVAFQGAVGEIEAFKSAQDEGGNPKYPFFDEVIGDVKAIVDFHNANGQPVTLESAYNKAIRLNESVWAKHAEQDRKRAEERARKEAERLASEAGKARAASGAKSPAGRGSSSGPDRPKDAMSAVRMAEKELGL